MKKLDYYALGLLMAILVPHTESLITHVLGLVIGTVAFIYGAQSEN